MREYTQIELAQLQDVLNDQLRLSADQLRGLTTGTLMWAEDTPLKGDLRRLLWFGLELVLENQLKDETHETTLAQL